MTPALRLEWPPEGEVLNRHDGRLSTRALLTLVRGAAPPGETVTVNGVPADRDGEYFTALGGGARLRPVLLERGGH